MRQVSILHCIDPEHNLAQSVKGCLSCWCRGQRLNEHIVIGAHGRLKNLLGKRQLDVSAIKILVFDEADIMLEVTS